MFKLKEPIKESVLKNYGFEEKSTDWRYMSGEKLYGYNRNRVRIVISKKDGAMTINSYVADVLEILYDMIRKDYIIFINPNDKEAKRIKLKQQINELEEKLKKLDEDN